LTTYAPPEEHPLWPEQVKLEETMATRGVDRFRHNLERNQSQGRATSMGGARTAMASVVGPLSEAIEAFMEAAKGPKAGPKHSLVRLIQATEPAVLAYLTTRSILQGNRRKTIKLTSTAEVLGSALEMEEVVNRFKKLNPKLCNVIVHDLNTRTGHEGHRVKVMRYVLNQHMDGGWRIWSKNDRVHLGVKLLELLAEVTGIITFQRAAHGRKSLWIINLSPSFHTWIQQLDCVNELKLPSFMPCVIPPKPWTSVTSGGYHTQSFIYPPKIVRRCSSEQQALLEAADLTDVYAAINAIQSTAWMVEKRTLEVAEAVVERRLDIGVLPPMEMEPLPTKPIDIATNVEARTSWKHVARVIHDRNERSGSKKLLTLRQLALSREFADYEAIYFPHSLDFRGRLYPIPADLNPQESDLARAMLVFATGKPLTNERAVGWFAIHGCNMWGEDKLPLDERVNWAYQNSEKIFASAADPLADLWWTDAAEPWCFLTWAFEWRDFMADVDGTFVSRVPIAMDGTCNGIQHYSAMLRDPVGGAAVNLLPSDHPQDIYEEVAKVVRQRLTESTNPMAQAWLAFGIDRKITKRPVMVLPYGGTQKSCRDYVCDVVKEKIREGAHDPFGDDLIQASNWLAKIVWDSIGDVVVAARDAMDWLKGVARKATDTGEAMTWATPSGFIVRQAYVKQLQNRVDTNLHGSVVKLVLNYETKELDRRRQVNGIAPNFVHSLDAAALTATVAMAVDNGVDAFAMIHDSYGTWAADADVLASCTRHAFVDMYTDHDVLEEFALSVSKITGIDALEDTPPPGDLDLTEVLESPFFFA